MKILISLCLFFTNFFTSLCIEPAQRIFFPIVEKLPETACVTYHNKDGTCRLISSCSSSFLEIAELSRSPCKITEYQDGVCCPNPKAPTKDPTDTLNSIIDVENIPINFPEVTHQELNFACEQGLLNQTVREEFQHHLAANHIEVDKNSPAFLHARLFETSPDIIQLSNDANVVLETSKELSKTFQLSSEQKKVGLPKINFKESIIKDKCPPKPRCPDPRVRYRTADGSCNNILNENAGRRGAPFKRMRPAEYADGLSVVRKAVGGGELPSARLVSSGISLPLSDIYVNFTILIWQWGQFLDHDITHAPISKGANGADISCCLAGNPRPPDQLDPECLPIEISETDSFYASFGQRCMEFTRSMAAVKTDCSLGPREQINQITAYIDASNVYGSSDADVEKLRDRSGGRLKIQNGNLLPVDPKEGGCKRPENPSQKCFLAGDSRVNEQVNLALLHTIWVRQHNNIAAELARLNPGWSDEVLYQEARRIVGAQMQHITYNEYLPIVLGKEFMETFGLLPQRSGYFSGYTPKADASIVNGFAAAAFRYGHTLINDHIQGFNEFGHLHEDFQLSSIAFSPFPLYKSGTFDHMLRGLALQHSQKFDRNFSPELTNKLFATGPFGMDLVALNIQRGRDHGIAPYVKWRETCNLTRVSSWQDLLMEDPNVVHIPPIVVNELRKIYKDVRDVDLFIAGVSERVVPGSLVGPTFQCILGHQFITLKIGDRFYYENGINPNDRTGPPAGHMASFTLAQLDEIRKTTLARILCDNSDNSELMEIQPLVLITPHSVNKRSLCSADFIPRMSLEPWKNTRVWN